MDKPNLHAPFPSDAEIRAAYAQGEQAVIDLFHRTLARITAFAFPREGWLRAAQSAPAAPDAPREIRQGDIYWLTPGALDEGVQHPQVIIQDDVINRSRVPVVVVCALTTNRSRASLPGNVLLEAGEASLPRQSVVEVAKVSAVQKSQLGEYVGRLSAARVRQILQGMQFLQNISPQSPGAE